MKDVIVQTGDPVLREKSKPISKKEIGSRALSVLIAKMKKALAAEEYGVAIAAPQVGAAVRMFVVAGRIFVEDEDKEAKDVEKSKSKKASQEPDRVYINPEITRVSKKKKEMAEGCLSVRGQYGTVLRHEKATIKAFDEMGRPIHQHASGLLAQIFQHETDHLDGILFTDKVEHIEEWKPEQHEH